MVNVFLAGVDSIERKVAEKGTAANHVRALGRML